jgi:predicted nuclease with TOPRIM domain
MTEHQERADRLEHEADQLEERSERLGDEISGAREHWSQKKADERVPGTPPVPKDSDDQGDGEREPWPDE